MRKATPGKTSSQPASASIPSTLFPTAASIEGAAAAKAAAAKPVAGTPAAGTPAAAKPAATKPVAKPAAAKAAAVKPAATKPVAAKAAAPAASKAVAAKPTAARVRSTAAAAVDIDTREKARKPKLVRDSFTMPEQEYAVLGQVKKACLKAGFDIKKSELLRIGVALINQIDLVTLKTVLVALPQLKTGRPKKN
jgi:hypothetical protein